MHRLLLALTLACSPAPDDTGRSDDRDGDGFTPAEGDCDDTDPDVSPVATEIWYDGVDQDCDGQDDDQDGDGALLADDCDDTDADVHPEAVDTLGDGVDTDCSGTDAGGFHPLGEPGDAILAGPAVDADPHGFTAVLVVGSASLLEIRTFDPALELDELTRETMPAPWDDVEMVWGATGAAEILRIGAGGDLFVVSGNRYAGGLEPGFVYVRNTNAWTWWSWGGLATDVHTVAIAPTTGAGVAVVACGDGVHHAVGTPLDLATGLGDRSDTSATALDCAADAEGAWVVHADSSLHRYAADDGDLVLEDEPIPGARTIQVLPEGSLSVVDGALQLDTDAGAFPVPATAPVRARAAVASGVWTIAWANEAGDVGIAHGPRAALETVEVTAPGVARDALDVAATTRGFAVAARTGDTAVLLRTAL